MSDLVTESCEACRADAPKVSDEELAELIKEIPNWQPITEDNILRLRRTFEFKNYLSAVEFTKSIAQMSEEEGHHPEILFGCGYAKINITTHAIKGLSENDFILAAKIDQIFND